jgi:hypothetical protein
MRKVFHLVAIMAMSFGLATGQSVVFHEDFELPSGADSIVSASNTTNAWAINTVYASQGLRSTHCAVQVGDITTLSTLSFNTTGNLFVMLEFDHICKVSWDDNAELYISTDNGLTWVKLTSNEYMGAGQFGTLNNRFTAASYLDWDPIDNNTMPTNGWWKSEQFNISQIAGNQSNVLVRFQLSDMGAPGGMGAYGWLIDNIRVTAYIDEMIPPVITLATPILGDTVYHTGPFQVFADITDDSGIDTAVVVYTVNTGTPDTLGMYLQSGSVYTAEIPSHTYNTEICYHIVAWDGSTYSNMARDPATGCRNFLVKQPPAIVEIGTGTSQNATSGPTYISSAASSYRYSNHISLFTPAEINAAGIIEAIGWNKANSNGYNNGNATFRIYLKHTSMTSIPTANNTFAAELAGATLVYESTTQNLPLSTGWVTFNFNMPNTFNYNGSDNLMVLVDWYRPDNATGGVNWFYTSATGKGQTWSSSTTPPTISYGTNNRPNIQIGFQQTNYAYDVGIAQITEPSGSAIVGNNPVRVFLRNYGTDTITKANIYYTYNGQVRPVYNWTGVLLPYLSSGLITLGNEQMVPGSYEVKAWASMPNDSVDQNPNNDTAYASGFACLSILNGTYLVGSSSGADFATVADAVSAIDQCGMSGPVVFEIEAGTYHGQMSFQHIPAASLTNTITFRSSTGNPNDVTIRYNATGTADNYVLQLDGAKHLRFEHLTFMAENASFGNVIWIGNGSSNNTFTGNKVIGPMVSVNNINIALVHSPTGTTSNDSNNVFRLNEFYYGSYGFYYCGPSSSVHEQGTVIDSNKFFDQYYRAIDIRNQDAPVITSNYIFSNTEAVHGTAATYNYGMYLYYCQNEMLVERNHIHTPRGTYGIYVGNCTSTPGREALFANNMIAEVGGFTFVYGFYVINSHHHFYYHNSVNITSPTSNAGHAFFLQSGSNIQLMNNIFANTGGAFCVRVNAPAAISRSNYNNLFSLAATNWGWWNGTISNLAMWKSASGVDTNSVSINPGFTSPADLHVSSIPMDNLGTPVALVTDDFDWEPRSLTTPDIGADEYTPPAKDILFTSVLWPRSSCVLGPQEEVELLIRNNGTDPVTSFQASYQINGQAPVTETFTKSIPPLTTDTLRFTTLANFSANGIYSMVFYTDLPLDENRHNDTISDYVFFNSHNFYDAAYETSFEIDDPTRGVYTFIDVNNDNSRWHFFGGANNSRTGMIYMGYECNQSNYGDDWFFSRCFTFEANRTYELSFWYKTSDASYSQSVDIMIGNAMSTAAMTTTLVSMPSFSNAAYEKATVLFTVPATGQYHFGFYAYSPPVATTTQVMACIDDLTIRMIPPYDAGVIGVTAPNHGCGLTQEPVSIIVKNHGTSNIISGLTASYTVDNHPTAVTEPVSGVLLSGDSLYFTFNTPVSLTSLADTTYTITAWTNLPGDTLSSSNANDTLSRIVKSFSLPDPPIVLNDTINSGSTALLTAQSANTVYWYNDPASGSPLASGNQYITPPLFATQTFYAETGVEDPVSHIRGSGTTISYNMPFHGNNDFGWSAFRITYPSMGYIDSIGFEVSNNVSQFMMQNQKIYMALVPDSVFTATTRPNPLIMELVYNGAITYNGPGWQMIGLQTPFFYDPDYALMVYYENHKGSISAGYPGFRYSSTNPDYQAIYRNQNSSFPAQDGFFSYSRPNIKVAMREGTGCRSNRVPATAVVVLPPNDAGISSIDSPPAITQTGSTLPVIVEVKNYGTNTLTQIPVSYQLNSQPIVIQNWTGSLASTQTDTLSFPPVTIPVGLSTLKAWTSLSGDGVSLNDTTTMQILGTNLETLSFFDDFDGPTQFQPNNLPYTNWQVGVPAYGSLDSAYSAPNSWCTNLSAAYYINAEAMLTTPLFDFSNAVNANMHFWVNYNSEAGHDGMYIEYSTNNGMHWHLLGSVNDANGHNWYNTSMLSTSNGAAWSGNSQGWQHVSYNLHQFSGAAAVQFRFVFVSNSSGNMDGFCIDDFAITLPPTVDAAVSGLVSPQQNAPEGSSPDVVVAVRNMGSDPLTAFTVGYQMNQGAVQTTNWSGTLLPGDITSITLSSLLVPAGFYQVCAWVEATGDGNNQNDTLCSVLYGKAKYDAAAVQIVSPMVYHIEGQSIPVKVLIRNYGVDTLTSIPVGYHIDGGAVVSATYSGVLYPNGADTVHFPAILVQPGQQRFCAFTQLPQDFEPNNDTVCKMVYAKPLLDIAPIALHAPSGTGCNHSAMQVSIRLRNNGADTIHFNQNPCTLDVSVTGMNPTTFNPAVISSGSLPPLGEANVIVTNTYNMSQAGVYSFTATTTMAGDGDPSNNTFGPHSIGGVTSITSFPRYENFETGHNSLMRMQPAQHAALSVTSHAANGSQYGLHFQGGNPLGWIGEASGANATTYYQAFTTNSTHLANAVSCNINATGTNALKLRLDLRQTYSQGPAFSWFRVLANNQVIPNQDGDTLFVPNTQSGDPWVTHVFDLSSFTGSIFTITLQASNKNPYSFAGTPGDNAFVDNIMIFEQAQHDAGITAFLQPAGTNAAAGTTIPVEVRIENFGLSTITTSQVGYQVGNSPPVFETWTGSVSPGGSTTYTFSTPATVLPGNFVIKAFTNLANDPYPLNDTASMGFLGIPLLVLPYTDDMEGTNFWVTEGSINTWERGYPAGLTINYPYNGSNSWATNLSGFYPNNANEFLISPFFDFSNTTGATLRFYHWLNMEANFDGGQVQYSLNNGQNWINLGYIMDPNGVNWYTHNVGGVNCFSGTSSGYALSSYDLSFLDNHPTPVRFRFRFFSNASGNNYDGWAIDQFSISVPPIPIDAGVMMVVQPSVSTEKGAQIPVEVRIKNYGTDPLTSIPVSYKVPDMQAVNEVWTGTLPSGAEVNHTFLQHYTGPAQAYTLRAYTTVPGDIYTHNDTTSVNLQTTAGDRDVAITRLVYPKESWPVVCDSAKVVVLNAGYDPITALTFKYFINSNELSSQSWSGNLAPGDSMVYTFPQSFPVPAGGFTACVGVVLTNDVDTTNNKLCVGITDCYTSIAEYRASLLTLYQNIPNPSNGNTTIGFRTGEAGKIRFFVSDLIGRKVLVKTLQVEAGLHTIELQKGDTPAGFYLYGIEFNGQRIVKRMLVQE